MDHRDRHIQRHHQKRLAVCQSLSVARQVQDAEKQMEIAKAHHRTALFLMLALWRAKLEGLSNGSPSGAPTPQERPTETTQQG